MAAEDPNLLAFVHRFARTRELAAKALREQPNDIRAVYGAAMAYRLSGDYESACEQFKRAAELQPNNPDLLCELGTLQEYLGAAEDAKASHAKAIRLAPGHYRSRLALVTLEKQTAERNSIKALEPLFEGHDPDGWRTLHVGHALAKTYDDLADFSQSFAWLAKAKRRRREIQPYSTADNERISAAVIDAAATVQRGEGYGSAEPLFVCGLPRSGTTLVDRILSSHPDVVSAGEISNFNQTLKLLTNAASALSLEALRRAPDAGYARLGKLYIDSTRPLTGQSRHFVDKAPSNYLLAETILRALPNARVICVRRHPADSCLSNYKQIFPLPDRYYDYVYSLESIAHKFIQFDRVATHWKRTLPPDRYLELQYEDLVANQEEQTRALVQFCGLPWNDRCLNFHENAAGVATPSASQVRRAMNSSGVGRWKNYQSFLAPALSAIEAAGIAVT